MTAEEITFFGKRWCSITKLAVAAVLCATGVATLSLGYTIVGILLLLGAVAPAVTSLQPALFPRSRYLRLDSSGFEIGLRHNRDHVEWNDITGFEWGSHDDVLVIEVLYAPEYRQQRCLTSTQLFTGRILDQYTVPLTEVLEKLVEWQQRYGLATTPSVRRRTA